jgi:hypothetical protein
VIQISFRFFRFGCKTKFKYPSTTGKLTSDEAQLLIEGVGAISA